MSTARKLALLAGMLTKDIPWARSIRHLLHPSMHRDGGYNFHQSQAWRGKKKAFLGYGYLPETKEGGGMTFKLFPDTVYMVDKHGASVKVLRINEKQMIVGRKAIKKYLEVYRKQADARKAS